MKVYSIKDAAADYWLPLFLARNDDHAIRMFHQSLGDQFQFREDYTLFRFGSWDDDQGVLVADDAELVCHGHSLATPFQIEKAAS